MTHPDKSLATSGPEITRRSLLKGAAASAGLLAAPSLLAACGGDDEVGGEVSVGSNASDPLTKDAYGAMFSRFEEKNPDITLAINTVDHNTFQEQINTYLQGVPDDVFTWFAGFRMQFFADKGLSTSINDVWDEIGSNYASSFKQASTGLDDNQYFVPFITYPWALFYRKSFFADNGYTVPTTIQELKDLGDGMLANGHVPIAFGDKDGWPAMGTFDYLNMRVNGYQYHVDPLRTVRSGTTTAPRPCSLSGQSYSPTTSPAPSAAPGRKLRSLLRTRMPACICWACSSASSSKRPRRRPGTISTSSHSRRSIRRMARTLSMHRSTVSWFQRTRRTWKLPRSS